MIILETLAQSWEARGLKSHPTDTMLINLHVRELREALAALRAEAGAVGWIGHKSPEKDQFGAVRAASAYSHAASTKNAALAQARRNDLP